MFSHVMIGTNDLPRAKAFYDAVLGTLGVAPGHVDRHRVFWRTPTGVFSVSLPINGEPATVGNGSTLGFACTSAEQVQAWHAAGTANGGSTCEDPRACARVPQASSIWPIFVTRTATRSAACTACPRPEQRFNTALRHQGSRCPS